MFKIMMGEKIHGSLSQGYKSQLENLSRDKSGQAKHKILSTVIYELLSPHW